jgi:hypothetical protein
MNLKKPIWFNKNIKKELVNFLKLYQKRPIKNIREKKQKNILKNLIFFIKLNKGYIISILLFIFLFFILLYVIKIIL